MYDSDGGAVCGADVLITDYSSVMFDYLLYKKPLVLFSPDLAEYEAKRGFYLDYRSMRFRLWRWRALAGAIEGSAAYAEAHRQSRRSFVRPIPERATDRRQSGF